MWWVEEGWYEWLTSCLQDRAQYLDQVYLRGKLRGLKEWNEGYEELESIPYSFAIEFKDERGSWSAFADNEEEKVRCPSLSPALLLTLLAVQVAGTSQTSSWAVIFVLLCLTDLVVEDSGGGPWIYGGPSLLYLYS